MVKKWRFNHVEVESVKDCDGFCCVIFFLWTEIYQQIDRPTQAVTGRQLGYKCEHKALTSTLKLYQLEPHKAVAEVSR